MAVKHSQGEVIPVPKPFAPLHRQSSSGPGIRLVPNTVQSIGPSYKKLGSTLSTKQVIDGTLFEGKGSQQPQGF